jgi:hypothetical protein
MAASEEKQEFGSNGAATQGGAAANTAHGTHNTTAFADTVNFDKETDGRSSESAPGTPVPAAPAQPPAAGGVAHEEKPAEKMSKGRIALIMSALCVCLLFVYLYWITLIF